MPCPYFEQKNKLCNAVLKMFGIKKKYVFNWHYMGGYCSGTKKYEKQWTSCAVFRNAKENNIPLPDPLNPSRRRGSIRDIR